VKKNLVNKGVIASSLLAIDRHCSLVRGL